MRVVDPMFVTGLVTGHTVVMLSSLPTCKAKKKKKVPKSLGLGSEPQFR